MNRGIESVRGAMQFGIEAGKKNMVVYLEELRQLFEQRDALLAACEEALALLAQPTPPNGFPILPGETIADSICALPIGGYRVQATLEAAIENAKGQSPR